MTITINIQINTELYKELEAILAKDNLTIEESIHLFFTETIRQGKMPFDYTEADIEEARNNPCVIITYDE